MAVSALSAAKELARLSNWSLTNLQLQKILYLAHMVYMYQNEGAPLIVEGFQAWDYGPVQPSVYHRAKIYGAAPVGSIFLDVSNIDGDSKEAAILKQAYSELSGLTGGQLVHATHKKGGAWDKNYEPGRRNHPIPNDQILEEYKSKWADNVRRS